MVVALLVALPRLAWSFISMVSIIVDSVQAEEKKNRFFEIRTYYANEGKLDALKARFRDHTVALFKKHGMTNIGYWVPVDNKDNKLVYILAFPDKEARKKAERAEKTAALRPLTATAAATRDGKSQRRPPGLV